MAPKLEEEDTVPELPLPTPLPEGFSVLRARERVVLGFTELP